MLVVISILLLLVIFIFVPSLTCFINLTDFLPEVVGYYLDYMNLQICYGKAELIVFLCILGFISGSLGVIWPWREKVFKLNEEGDIINNSIGNPEIAYYDYPLPNIKTIDFWFLILFIILGAITVTLLERYGVKKNK